MTRDSIDVQSSRLLVVDFGSQYTQLIARRIRSLGVYCEICAYDASPALVQSFRPDGVILSGGPETVVEDATPRLSTEFLDLAVPILGICYGMQVLAAQLGGQVEMSARHEFGHTDITPSSDSRLLHGLGSELDVWMSHGDSVVALPTGFEVSAKSDNAPVAAMEHPQRHLYGLQFHPEVSHTSRGTEILRRFVIDICGCIPTWRPANIVSSTIESVREQVGTDRVLLGLSGGVDSSVVAAILSRAIGDQLECLCIDNGLLRKDELSEIEEAFRPTNALSINLRTVDATETFMSRLEGVAEPEAKRKVVGETFIEVFEREARQLDNIQWLAQGTIYPDVIESAQSKFGKAHVIKSHHNVGGLPSRLNLKLLEPLRELFKDEVRQVGLELGLPSSLVHRHPFPGPGLSVRILGQVKPEDVQTLQAADAIFIEELRASGLYDKVSQAFTVFLPVRSVGVVGDSRRFEPVIALRAVETDDFMTAKFAELPYSLIQKVSNRITNEIPRVSRVVYDVSSKPPATIEWE